MSKPLILTPAQAKAVYDAMCALNNVGARIRATIPPDNQHSPIEVRENAVGEVFVQGFGCEIYADQAGFYTAYSLNADVPAGA